MPSMKPSATLPARSAYNTNESTRWPGPLRRHDGEITQSYPIRLNFLLSNCSIRMGLLKQLKLLFKRGRIRGQFYHPSQLLKCPLLYLFVRFPGSGSHLDVRPPAHLLLPRSPHMPCRSWYFGSTVTLRHRHWSSIRPVSCPAASSAPIATSFFSSSFDSSPCPRFGDSSLTGILREARFQGASCKWVKVMFLIGPETTVSRQTGLEVREDLVKTYVFQEIYSTRG